MANYIKDNKLVLFYIGCEKGLPVQHLSRFVTDDVSGESLVISARTGPMSSDCFYNNEFEVDMANGLIKILREKKLVDYLWHLTHSDLHQFLQLSDRNQTTFDEIMVRWIDVKAYKLMVLAYWDGSSPDEINNMLKDTATSCSFDFSNFKIGGPELMAEYLLADFCITNTTKSVRKLGHEKNYVAEDDILSSILEPEAFEEVPNWDIKILGSIEAPEYFEDYDEGQAYKDSNRLYYYSLELKALNKLHEMLYIPYRVEKILTQEQLLELKNQAPQILLDEMDYLARVVFLQKLDDFRSDQYRSITAARAAAWNSTFYDDMGGDGVQSVYLGDGVSITSTGRLVDD
jgi:hypothetical protein